MKLGEATKFEYKGDQAKTKKERLVIDEQVYFTVGDIGYLNDEGYVVKNSSNEGALSIGIPGTIAGLFEVYKKFGILDC